MQTTSGRLLALLALLQARRSWAGPELAERLEVSIRTIRRDIESLRDLGYAIGSVSGPGGGYRLRAGTAMPPLLLDDEEAVAMAIGLASAAHSSVAGVGEAAVRALVKLDQVLPARLGGRVRALRSAISAAPSPRLDVDPHTLTLLAEAARDRIPVRFAYRDRAGAESRREVEPYALVSLGRRWYLLAWDRRRDDWRSFRIDRLARPSAGGAPFTPREPPGGDAARFVSSRIPDAPRRYNARVTVHAPAERVVEPARRLWSEVIARDDTTCELRTSDDDLDWLALRLTLLDEDLSIHEPPELVARVADLGRRLLDATSDRASTSGS